jgi:uncharacterized membrane protein YkvA (DUF1232 family)
LLDRIKSWAQSLRGDVLALWIAARDPRTPALAKIIAGMVAAYALSPVDLIPDFIPVLGYLDDLVIVPLGIALALRLIPPLLLSEFRCDAASVAGRPVSKWAALMIGLLWLIAVTMFGVWLNGAVR